ncbi:MAG TPA: hypothetical protein VNO70_08410 [Blastocatellia bacterium]|nr:hypothetical protein [Blastocatellia bacterium]
MNRPALQRQFALWLTLALLTAAPAAYGQRSRDIGNVSVIIDDGTAVGSGRKPKVNLAAVGRAFYRDHPDVFDILVVFTDFENDLGEALAFYRPVRNTTRGIGVAVGEIPNAAEYGSPQRLQGVVNMNRIQIYPQDVLAPVPAGALPGVSPNTLTLLAHEVAHRFLAHVRYDSDPGPGISPSNEMILGRQMTHWNFYLEAQASVMDGVGWRHDGGDSFTAIDHFSTYSELDQYLMGARPPGEVAPWFLIQEPQPLFSGDVRDVTTVTVGGETHKVLIDEKDFGPRAILAYTTLVSRPGSRKERKHTIFFNEQDRNNPALGRVVVFNFFLFEEKKKKVKLRPGHAYVIRHDEQGPTRHRMATVSPDGRLDFVNGPNVNVRGARRDITLNDVIAVEGPRMPAFGQAPTTLRLAFILLQRSGTEVNQGAVEQIENIRVRFEAFFMQHTNGRLRIDSNLSGP